MLSVQQARPSVEPRRASIDELLTGAPGERRPKPSAPDLPAFPARILDNVFLGDVKDASTESLLVAALHITHIVDAANDGMAGEIRRGGMGDRFTYCLVPVEDDLKANISAHFERVFAFIDEARADPAARVFVHCREGVSRSVALVLYYLMASTTTSYSLGKAYAHVKSVREQAAPNDHFCAQLLKAELKLRGENSVDLTLVRPPLAAPPSGLAALRAWWRKVWAQLPTPPPSPSESLKKRAGAGSQHV